MKGYTVTGVIKKTITNTSYHKYYADIQSNFNGKMKRIALTRCEYIELTKVNGN